LTETAVERVAVQPRPPRRCPECGSAKLWRDGLRYLSDGGGVQRWLCRNCGYRFSLSQAEEGLNSPFSKHVKRRVCVSLARGAKNLAEKPLKEGLAGATADSKTVKGLVLQYEFWLEKEGYSASYLDRIRQVVRKGANLLDPENVKKVIGQQRWRDGTKMLTVCAYDVMVKHVLKTEWKRPKYKQEEILPFIPKESELDQLIAACRSKRMAAYLQTLKETYADPTEALRIRWIELSGNVLTINHPVKGHNCGQYKISNKLVSMLNNLPKKSERIFPTTYKTTVGSYHKIRNRLAQNTQNPRLLSIKLTTFRHWGGTMIAHRTNGNLLKVQKALRHKNIKNTMKYINLINFQENEYDVETAETPEEAKKLATVGYEKFDEFQGVHIYRKPKLFDS